MAGQLPGGLELRTIADAEYAAWTHAVGRQFGVEVADDELDAYRSVNDLDQTTGCSTAIRSWAPPPPIRFP